MPSNYSADRFAETWGIWSYKGHDPVSKLKLIKTHEGYAVGLLDYITLTEHITPSSQAFKSYEEAFADIGRALDKALCKDNEK